MGEMGQILALWHRARARGEQVCLATVVHVQGSSYRKPGARMLVTSGGERAGTISGGCLEGEVSRKAWWLTEQGPSIQQYQSSFEEDVAGEPVDIPWGLGCGGTLWVLLERDPAMVLATLEAAVVQGTPAAIVTSLAQAGAAAGTRLVLAQGKTDRTARPFGLAAAAAKTLATSQHQTLDAQCQPFPALSSLGAEVPAYFVELVAPPARLSIFGAGDDAQPIARFADALGWRVTIADGRGHLLRAERFPEAAELRLLRYADAGSDQVTTCSLSDADTNAVEQSRAAARGKRPQAGPDRSIAIPSVDPGVQTGELAVLLTHSFEQDRALLLALLPKVPAELAYLGILGPRHRTVRLLDDVAPLLRLTSDQCLARLHAPVGLDLGAREPAAIALAIVAELQATLAGRRVQLEPVGKVLPARPVTVATRD
jgi:xanthine dehydrogenase accessory factor